jgi:cell wall-associated NlpC family hydrolase
MAPSTGISGVAVSVATLGAVLVYAGLRGVNPAQALRDVAGGKPPPVVGTPTTIAPSGADLVPAGGGSVTASGLRGKVVSAAQSYSGDVYSQPKRRQAGYSDCSAFVDKALRSAGIAPPGDPWANTANYRLAGNWTTIPLSATQPGDIVVNSHHMILITGAGGSSAIGQQKTGVNVRTGPASSLISGGVARTYRGYTTSGVKAA